MSEELLEQIRVLKKRIAELGEENANWERWRTVARTERDKLEAENARLKQAVNRTERLLMQLAETEQERDALKEQIARLMAGVTTAQSLNKEGKA